MLADQTGEKRHFIVVYGKHAYALLDATPDV